MNVVGITLVEGSEQRTLGALVYRAAARFGRRPFLRGDDGGPALSFAAFDRLTSRFAAGLQRQIDPGEHIGLLVPTTPAAVVAEYAVVKAGAVPVLISERYVGELLTEALHSTFRGRLVIAPEEWGDRLPDAYRMLALEGLPRSDREPLHHRVRSSDLALVLPTSGTTGVPKGVLIPHNQAIHYAECGIALRRLVAQDRVHALTPIFHADGQFANVLAPMLVGAQVRLARRPSTRSFWEICREHGLTTFSYAGGLIALLHSKPERTDDAANPIRVAYGAPSPSDSARDFERRFGLRLREAYGSTECGLPLLTPWEGSRVEDGSCGRPTSGYEVRLNPDGELLVRSEFPDMWMQGYVDNAEATTRRLPGDGWFHTGDLFDEIGGGHFAFRGRNEDTIRRRGEFISPLAIERAAERHPSVIEAAAYGIRAREGEQAVALAVMCHNGAALERLHEHLGERLPAFMRPATIVTVDEFPRSPGSGKVQKHLLPGADPGGDGARRAL